MLAGVEPRPNPQKEVSPQRRHLRLSTDEARAPARKNTALWMTTTSSTTSPQNQKDHDRVERMGVRYHQKRAFASRGHGEYRSAENHNDLRTLLANVSNPALEKIHFSKRMFTKDTHDRSKQQLDAQAATAPAPRGVTPAILNSDSVRNILTSKPDMTMMQGQEKGPNADGSSDSDSGGRRAYVPTQVSSTSSSEEYAATVRSRIQPAMVSTLPIGWDSGSSWNPTPENSFQTSLQRQHSGQVCGSGSKNNWEGKNTRRLGRNRSVLKSQIQLG